MDFRSCPILFIDDESQVLVSYQLAFQALGFKQVTICQDPLEALDKIRESKPSMIVLDIHMPGRSGDELLEDIGLEYPDIPIIMLSGVNDVRVAVDCVKKGAVDYVVKPVNIDNLVSRMIKAMESRELVSECRSIRDSIFAKELRSPESFAGVITRDKQMFNIFQYLEAIANSSQPLLITGETGVGKELIARAAHEVSARQGRFVAVNAAGLDDNMFSDTLFGHVKGAFTGAASEREGVMERASEGTVFLDEIGDLPIASQVKLLRLLQEREYVPLGADAPRHSGARIILATHVNLEQAIRDGAFRKDLFYRITTHLVRVPPLRERQEDIHPLLDHFLTLAAKELGRPRPTYHPELVNLLKTYHFPGNVRELGAMVYQAVSQHESRMLSAKTFIEHMESRCGKTVQPPVDDQDPELEEFLTRLTNFPSLKETGSVLVKAAMRKANQNQSLAARLLGISPPALSKRLRKKEE